MPYKFRLIISHITRRLFIIITRRLYYIITLFNKTYFKDFN
jgi:hypothetical protein